jgi:histidine triad (HIT) family protein
VPDCLFCRIASGQIPAKTVRENSRTIAFRDINQQAPTHVLVIPKEHYADVAAVAAAGGGLLEEMTRLAHSVAVDEGIGGSGYRVVFNSGPDAGQEVPHAHVIGGRRLEWPCPRVAGAATPERRDMRLTRADTMGGACQNSPAGDPLDLRERPIDRYLT